MTNAIDFEIESQFPLDHAGPFFFEFPRRIRGGEEARAKVVTGAQRSASSACFARLLRLYYARDDGYLRLAGSAIKNPVGRAVARLFLRLSPFPLARGNSEYRRVTTPLPMGPSLTGALSSLSFFFLFTCFSSPSAFCHHPRCVIRGKVICVREVGKKLGILWRSVAVFVERGGFWEEFGVPGFIGVYLKFRERIVLRNLEDFFSLESSMSDNNTLKLKFV